MWCPAPLPEGELHRRKLRSDKYKPPAGRLLEFYESDSSVEADEDTDAEAGVGPSAGGVTKHRTRSTVGKKSASSIAVAISAMKATEQKKRRGRGGLLPLRRWLLHRFRHPACGRLSRKKEEDEAIGELPAAEDQPARRPESPAAQR
jgi:hypothetical protein